MSQTNFDKLMDLLDQFNHAMLITRRNDELRSRPMAIADLTDDGRIRFITRDDSPKIDELDENAKVNICCMQDDELRFLSISGNARLSKDNALIDKTWQKKQTYWFSEGKDDPHVIVLEVIPSYAEYWDRSADGIVELILDKAQTALGSDVPGEHGNVEFGDKPL